MTTTYSKSIFPSLFSYAYIGAVKTERETYSGMEAEHWGKTT